MSNFTELSRKDRQRLADSISSVFAELDRNHDGTITQDELMNLFQKIDGFHKWTEGDFLKLFHGSDLNKDGRLSYTEFVDWLLALEIPQIYQRSRVKVPVHRTREILYPSGVFVKVTEVQKELSKNGYFQQLKKEKPPGIGSQVRKFLYDRSYNRTLHKIFLDSDHNETSTLEWNDGEVYEFCMTVFEHLGLPRPTRGAGPGDPMIYTVYEKFDEDQSGTLDERECLCMTDAILRAIARGTRGPDDSSEDED